MHKDKHLLESIRTNKHSLSPRLRLSKSEKKKMFGSVRNWKIAVFEYLSGCNFGQNIISFNEHEKQSLYNLKNGIFDEADMLHHTNPYMDADSVLPANVQNWNIILNNVNTLKGEEYQRPDIFVVSAVDRGSINRNLERKNKMVVDYFTKNLMQDILKAGIKLGQEEEELPKDLETYLKQNFRAKEEIAQGKVLEYIKKTYNIDETMEECFDDGLTVGEEYAKIYSVGNKLFCRKVNPLYFKHEKSSEKKYVDEASWAIEGRWLTLSDIQDEFYDKLSSDDIDYLESIRDNNGSFSSQLSANPQQINWGSSNNSLHNSSIRYSSGLIQVVHCEFKAYDKINLLTYKNEHGLEVVVAVPDGYKKVNPEDKVESCWVNIVYEVTKIGDYIYIADEEPKRNQYRSKDNPAMCRLSYTGVEFAKNNSDPLSFVKILKPYQYFYNVIMYHIELAIAKAKGRGIIVDVSQLDMPLDKALYYVSAFGVIPINSAKDDGNINAYNQWKEYDLGLSSSFSQYLNLLNKIEERVQTLTGITPQRSGNINASELVSNVQASITQSTYITEVFYRYHEQFQKRVYEMLLQEAKFVYKNGDVLSWVVDEVTKEMYRIDDHFLDSEAGIFVNYGKDEIKNHNTLKELALSAVQSGNTDLIDVIKVLNSKNFAESITILEKIKSETEQAQQAMQQAEQKAKQEEIQTKIQLEQVKGNIQKELEQIKGKNSMAVEQLKLEFKQKEIDILDKEANSEQTKVQNHNENEKLKRGSDLLEIELEKEKVILDQEKEKLKQQKENTKPKKE